MQVGAAEQLDEDLWVIDTLFQGEPGVIASYLLTGTDGLALIDVGSGASVEEVLAGIRIAGFDPLDVAHLVLTHVHLDHAGAAGALVRRMPRARVYVHHVGAPHLVDPSRLLSSATRIYGEEMERLWGTMEPVPSDRIQILSDGESITVGSRSLRAVETPGHAIHHLAYFDAQRRELFPGDISGVRLQGSNFVRPPTPPPDLNLEDWYSSIDRIAELSPVALYLPHFGRATGLAPHLEQLRRRLADWGSLMLSGIRENQSDARLAEMLAQASDADIARNDADDTTLVTRYELATNYLMSAQGYVRYYRKVHPDLLA